MKKYVLPISILFASLFYGCGDTQKVKLSDVYIMIDVTDKDFKDENVISESVPKILKKMNIDPTKADMAGGEIKIFTINDLSETKSTTVKLAQGLEGLLGQNPLDRQDEIKKFQSDFAASIKGMLSGLNWNKDKSKIYQNICRELNNLVKKEDNHKKMMIIFSDMLENSTLLSFYNTNTDALISQIEAFEKNTLSKDCLMPDLSAIEI